MGIKKAPYIRSPIDPKTMADQQGTIPSMLGVFIVIFECRKTILFNELIISFHVYYQIKNILSSCFFFFFLLFLSKNTWQEFLNILFCLVWRRQYCHNLFSQIIAVMNVPIIMIQGVSSKRNRKRFNVLIRRQPFWVSRLFLWSDRRTG